MQFVRNLLDKQEKLFKKGSKLEKLYPLHEAGDTFMFTPGEVTKEASHVRDAADLKRIMSMVVVALLPCVYMAMYNTGRQAATAIKGGAAALDNWQTSAMASLGLAINDPTDMLACIVHGALYYLPVVIMTLAVGGGIEAVFAIVRNHEINEGFLVTWMLFPLILPPTIPLWQVAAGILFGVLVGKEIFGGTGMNILNPALTARAFLFFAYPAEISGDKVWIAAETAPDGYSGATWLAEAAAYLPGGSSESVDAMLEQNVGWTNAFLGLVAGSMGETSTLACLIGAVILIATGIGSWRIMGSLVAGSFVASLLLNAVGSETNYLINIPFHWHIVLGGWAFGLVYMATDPVSATHTNTGKYIYGFLIGVLAIFIRVLNPAFPEGMMLAILLMNVFAATIDHFVVQANVRRRKARYAT